MSVNKGNDKKQIRERATEKQISYISYLLDIDIEDIEEAKLSKYSAFLLITEISSLIEKEDGALKLQIYKDCFVEFIRTKNPEKLKNIVSICKNNSKCL